MQFLKKNKRFLPFVISALAIALAMVTLTAMAEEKKETTEPSKQEQTSGSDLSAMKTGKDPDGSLRQTTKEEEKQLAAQIRATISKYPKQGLKTHPNGAKSVVTVPFSLAFSMVTKDQNGKTQYTCSNVGGIEKKSETSSPEKAEEQ